MNAYMRNISVEAIGPVEADRYLALGNAAHVDRVLVSQYVNSMRHGYWAYPGGVIEITATGELKDGHHRLLAVIEAGVTLPMIVVRGVTNNGSH